MAVGSVSTGLAGHSDGAWAGGPSPVPPPLDATGMKGRGSARACASVMRFTCVGAGVGDADEAGFGVLPECATSCVVAAVAVAVTVGRAARLPLDV